MTDLFVSRVQVASLLERSCTTWPMTRDARGTYFIFIYPIDLDQRDPLVRVPATGDEPGTHGASAAEPDDIAPPLARLIASIRAAVARGASVEARAVGASACRSILTVLDAKPGQPLAAAPQPVTSPASPLATLLSQPGLLSRLAAMSRDELINVLKQVTGAMPVQPQTPAAAAPRFHLIQIPVLRRPGGS